MAPLRSKHVVHILNKWTKNNEDYICSDKKEDFGNYLSVNRIVMYPLKLHKTLTPEKWQKFGESQQILMIACEISRAKHWIQKGDWEAVNDCYERAFELLDLTVSLTGKRNKRKELLRLREVIASQYIVEKKDFETNELIFKTLLSLNPESYAMENGGST